MRKQLYLAVIERLKTIVNESGEQTLRHFDLWNENVAFIEQEAIFAMPAVFVEFLPIDWKSLGGGVQSAQIQFRLHIVTNTKGSAADGSTYQPDALQLFDLLDDVHRALSGFRGSHFRQLQRVASHTNHNHEELIESIETFAVNVDDVSGQFAGNGGGSGG